MLLRRISQDLKDQNWTAVGIDFLIVVVGVFIGIQVSNWNEVQRAMSDERNILAQLAEEFTEIKRDLERQFEVREENVADLGQFIAILEGQGSPEDELLIHNGIEAATSSGRLPPRSAYYLQLSVSGGLTAMTNKELLVALVDYDSRLQRDAFLHAELVKLITVELTSNKFVDRNVLDTGRRTADIDTSSPDAAVSPTIRSFDIDGLRQFENRYETIYSLQQMLLTVEEKQLSLATEVLNQVETGVL